MTDYVKLAALLFALDAIYALVGFAKEADRAPYSGRSEKAIKHLIAFICNAGVAIWGYALICSTQ